ncbi:unnamed protein product [Amaranthus hypochondriacus]
MKASNGDKDDLIKLFGSPSPRLPLPSNSFNTIVKIFSLFSNDNPFSDYAHLPEYQSLYGVNRSNPKRHKSGIEQDDSFMLRGNKETPNALVEPAIVEGQRSSCNIGINSDSVAEVVCKDDSFIALQARDKMASNAKGTHAWIDEDALTDFCNNTTSSEIGKVHLDGNIKDDVSGEVRRKEFDGDLPVDREISNPEEAMNQHSSSGLEYPLLSKEREFSKEKAHDKLLEQEKVSFAAQRCKKGEVVSISNVVDRVGTRNKSNVATKGKAKKAPLKGVKLGKNKHTCINTGALNSTKSGGANLLTNRKMMEQNAHRNIGKIITRKVINNGPESSKGIHYTREQLLHLQNTTSVSADILNVIQKIGAEVHVEGRHSAVEETDSWKVDSSNNRKSEGKKAEEEGSSILKNRKRRSTSEATKEKKKRQKRKKRAEMNKKLGVKRLKLKTDLKPKVIPPCRHYLKGRCQEGVKCKFSHDVIPLTKSQPCCHFARNGCMKGDECPYDHQLSKYPCNNYVSTGFCVRGDSCLFSHKGSSSEGSKCETHSAQQVDGSNPKQQLNVSTSVASGSATPNIVQDDLAKRTSQPVSAPKGFSFLSFGKSSVKESAKPKESELTQKITDNVALTHGLLDSKKNNDDANTSNLSRSSLTPTSHKEIDSPASVRLPCVSSGSKSQEAATLSTNCRINSVITDKETANKPDILTSGQPVVGELRSTPTTARSGLLSTLSFAANFESRIKMNSATPSKELDKNEGTKDEAECRQNEQSKTSAILEFLYSGGNSNRK